MPAISLVIPAQNESKLLPRLLNSIEIARDRFFIGREQIEVVVAVNGSTDATAGYEGR